MHAAPTMSPDSRRTPPRGHLIPPAAPAPLARPLLAGLVLASLVLAGCGGGGASPTADGNTPPPAGGGMVDADARLLASNCFQCHGTDGRGGFDSIRGGEASEVREYRNLAHEPASADIMAAHAQGYTDDQISQIIRFLQQ